MLSVFVWVMAGTAMWHFSVLVPDRFYRGIIGTLAAANAGAIAAGFFASGLTPPDTPGLADALIGSAGGIAGLVVSWLGGSRYDPVLLDDLTVRHHSFARGLRTRWHDDHRPVGASQNLTGDASDRSPRSPRSA
jgi:hypothetical protein